MRWTVRGGCVGLACAWALVSAHAVPVWSSDVALWGHAVTVTPGKPRPWLNYGVALILAGRLGDAQTCFLNADRLSYRDSLDDVERDEIREAVRTDLAAIVTLDQVARCGAPCAR